MFKTSNEELYFALSVTLGAFLLIITVLFIVLYNSIKANRRRSSDILKAVFQSQELQRDYIAKEIHDELGSKISIIKLNNEFVVADSECKSAKDFAIKSALLIDELATQTRLISRDYASSLIQENGLKIELERLIDMYSELDKIQFKLILNIESIYLSDDFVINIYRVIQELCNNSIKHSQCQNITIELFENNGIFNVIYSDDGVGFDNASKSTGMGIRNIVGRVIAHQGHIEINSNPGTKYHLTFKLNIIENGQ